MALLAWFPLNNSITNLGENTFTITSPSFTGAVNTGGTGKTATYCGSFSTVSGAAQSYLSSETISLKSTDPISIFCWVKMNSFNMINDGAYLNGLVSNHNHGHNSDHGSGFGLNLRNDGSSFRVSISTSHTSGRTYSTYYGNTTFGTGEWHHVGFTYDGTKIRLYLDGNLDGESSFTSSYNSNNPIGLACWSTGFSDYGSECCLQDVRVYNHALSTKEIKNLARGLVVHYDFEDIYELVDCVNFFTLFTDAGTLDTLPATPDYNSFVLEVNATNAVPSSTSARTFIICNGTVTLSGSSGGVFVIMPILSPTWGIYVNGNGYYGYYDGTNYVDTSILASSGKAIITYNYTTHILTVNNYSVNVSFSSKPNGLMPCASRIAYVTSTTSINIYSLKFFDSNNKLVSAYLPATSHTDGTIGLYDRITNKFITSQLDILSANTQATPAKIQTKIVPDISGNCLHGQFNASTSFVSDTAIGTKAASCASTGIITPTLPVFTQYTISMWFKLGATGTMPLGSNTLTAQNTSFYCYGDNSWAYTTSAGWQEKYYNHNGGAVSTSNWVHWVATYDGTNTKIYRNGVLEGTDAVTTAGATVNFPQISVGYGYNGSSYWSTQKIADFRLYATALSADDILELYKCRGIIDKAGNIYSDSSIPGSEFTITKKGIATIDDYTKGGSIAKIAGSKYTRLEYIESVNGSAYINTNYIYSNSATDNARIVVDYTPVTLSDDGTYYKYRVSGSYNGEPYRAMILYGTPATAEQLRLGNGAGDYPVLVSGNAFHPAAGTRYLMDLTAKGGVVSGTVNGVTASGTYSGTVYSNRPYLIFANNENGTPGYYGRFRLYSFKMYDCDKLVRDFIPVKKGTAVGLYDLVEGKFYSNAGANSFTAGPEIGSLNAISCNNFYDDGGAAIATHNLLANKLIKNNITVVLNTGVNSIVVTKTDLDGGQSTQTFISNGTCSSAINYPYAWTASAKSSYSVYPSSGSGYFHNGEYTVISPTATRKTQTITISLPTNVASVTLTYYNASETSTTTTFTSNGSVTAAQGYTYSWTAKPARGYSLSSSSGTGTVSTVAITVPSTTATALTAYTMAFTSNTYCSWDSSTSATIYSGEYLEVSTLALGTILKPYVSCKSDSSSSATTYWTRQVTLGSETGYTYSFSNFYQGTSSSGTVLSSSTYDGSFTNIYAYTTRTQECSSYNVCTGRTICGNNIIICGSRTITCPTRGICTKDVLSNGDDLDNEWEEHII